MFTHPFRGRVNIFVRSVWLQWRVGEEKAHPDLDHDTDSSLDRRQERWTEAMIQKIHKIQRDDSHCLTSCPTLALSTKTYEADVRSKNLPDEIVASVVFVRVLVLN